MNTMNLLTCDPGTYTVSKADYAAARQAYCYPLTPDDLSGFCYVPEDANKWRTVHVIGLVGERLRVKVELGVSK